VEPISGEFSISDVRLNTITLHYGAAQIPVSDGKTVAGVDRDGNGAFEITACFGKPDLRTLFAALPNGKTTVTVMVQGNLVSGGSFQGTLDVDVQKSGGSAVEASVSPNPLNPQAIMTFSLAQPGTVRAALYDLSGRRVRTLWPESYTSAGYHDVTIDGRGDKGEKLPSGVYFYEIRTAEGSAQGRVTILK
jgi:hypothetical protein